MGLLLLLALAAVVGAYVLGDKSSSAHGLLAESQRALEAMAASLRDRTDQRDRLLVVAKDHQAEAGAFREQSEVWEQTAHEAQAQLAAAAREAADDRAETQGALDALTAEVDALAKRADALQARAEIAEAALEDALGRSAGLSADALDAARAFVAWCNQATPLVGRHYLFERALRRALPHAVVTPVYRTDAGGDGAGLAFRAAAEGAEYWLVMAGGERLLLPHPRTPDAFRELAPAFDGRAVPRSVGQVAPARLATDGDRLVLDTPGEVT